ncbi:MAG: metalloregulator ArsR/SmtB family transcription factor [Planctomycetales bacterium]
MSNPEATCATHDHEDDPRSIPFDATSCQHAAAIFSALGDPNRLRLLGLLVQREMCVTEIATALDDNLPAISQRLKLLRGERIVNYRREGKHVVYSLDDEHIVELIRNAVAHADHR